MTSSTRTLNVTADVSPSPGFCVKSKLLQPGILNVASAHETGQRPVPISEGLKVFVNIAWSKDVPPPLDGVEKALEFVAHNPRTDRKIESDSPISVFASDGRLDADKADPCISFVDALEDHFADPRYHLAGNPALVFDCIYNSSYKNHALKDAEFRKFLIERALQEIEAQNSISLSRALGTPNIASKGALEQRAVSIPAALFPPGHNSRPLLDKSPPKNLIEEVTSSPVTASKVDDPNKLSSPHRVNSKTTVTPLSNSTAETPSWMWSQEGEEIHITIRVPKLTLATVPSATLDLEPRRIMLHIPNLYALDIDLELSDADLKRTMIRVGADPTGTENALVLKRARDLDVDQARAEWRAMKRCLVIVA